jgi:hypothetical protein
MVVLRNIKKMSFSKIGQGVAVCITIVALMISMGCSTFSSSVFFVAQNKDPLLHEVKRSDWVTTNQGFGIVRPPLKAVFGSDNGAWKLTIYPVPIHGDIEMFGPPLLPIIWIPEFMYLPPLDPLNVLHFVVAGSLTDIRIESVNGMPVNQDCVKKEEYVGEAHYFLSISKSDAKKDALTVNISVGQNMIYLEFNKCRTKNCFPLFVPI